MSNLHSSMQAEQSVIGALMLDNDAWDVISDKITEHDFHYHNHQVIFRAIKLLAENAEPFDLVTISDALRVSNELDSVGGTSYLIALYDDTPTAKNIESYVRILIKKSLRRRVTKATVDMNNLSMDLSVDNDELMERVEACVSEITATGNDKAEIIGIKASMRNLVEDIERRYCCGNAMTGISTGLIDLDEITNGFQSKDLIILAARASMGKTATMMRFVEAAALRDSRPNVLIFSLEMPESSLTERMVSSISKIELNKIKTGKLEDEDWARLTSATILLSDTKIHYCDVSSISLAGMRTVIRRVEREHGKLSLIAVDYLQLIEEKGENETLKIGKISTGLKRIAKDFGVPLIALSQLNRESEKRTNKRPMMSDLRQSGQIEQDADLIIMLYRDEVYNKDSEDKGIMELIIAKHRNGAIGTIKASYIGMYTRVDNLHYSTSNY